MIEDAGVVGLLPSSHHILMTGHGSHPLYCDFDHLRGDLRGVFLKRQTAIAFHPGNSLIVVWLGDLRPKRRLRNGVGNGKIETGAIMTEPAKKKVQMFILLK